MSAPPTLTIAPSTLKNYKSSLKSLERAGYTSEKLASESKSVIEYIKERSSPTKSVGTIQNFMKAVIYHLRTTDKPEACKPYIEAMSGNKPAVDAIKVSQTLPEARLENMLSFPEVLALAPNAKKLLKPEDHLLYCLYTMMPPVRADFAEMVVKKTEKNLPETGNYLIAPANTKNYKFILNHYKTAKTLGKAVLDVPEPLAKVIKAFLIDRDGYIVYDTPLLKLKSPIALSQRVFLLMKKLSGKVMGISLLRHSYITEFLKTKRTIVERNALAAKMLHSASQQEQYDIIE